jgi:hypothetical protein
VYPPSSQAYPPPPPPEVVERVQVNWRRYCITDDRTIWSGSWKTNVVLSKRHSL